MATALPSPQRLVGNVVQSVYNNLDDVGDLAVFAGRVVAASCRLPYRGTFVPVCYQIGVRSVPVVMITGLFIGMVLAVQSYGEFAHVGLATQLGMIINTSVVRELGPVLAATMLAGRIGSAMAAELGTMRVTEQIDALDCLGANPIRYLAAPRFLACVLLIPLLTIVANFMGVMGGSVICTYVYHIDAHFYWRNAAGAITMYDLVTGLIKPMFFGGAIAILSCHRGFRSEGGAEGVGRAATNAFVTSFIAILALDFFLALFLTRLYTVVWPTAPGKFFQGG
jgi:phospholipid/cholesterol/gamma-HCH transport system permease protein